MISTGEQGRRSGGSRPLRIAMMGTRGVPAAYGGFETAVEEIGRRLVDRGHSVLVYCRPTPQTKTRATFLGMRLVHLPAIRVKAIETLSHTFLSAWHSVLHRSPDVAFLFNSANAPFIPLIRMRRVPVAVHVDGLEWKRDKWGRGGRLYYRAAEQLSVRWADALIADAQGIADYYTDEFGADTELITYGTKSVSGDVSDRLAELGLTPGGFHLAVARFEPENHVDVIVRGFAASDATLPLIVVGSAPYSAEYTDGIAAIAASDPRIRMLGGIWDQDLLDQLYANALTYLHGHSVGGTNPSLLRAMGAGTAVLAWDVNFNREVLGDAGEFFDDAAGVATLLVDAERDAESTQAVGRSLRDRATELYDWDQVSRAYEDLARRLANGHSTKGRFSGSRFTQSVRSLAQRKVHHG